MLWAVKKILLAKLLINKQIIFIAVKGNQKYLEIAIKDIVLLETPDDISINEDIGHGRVEKRTCYIYTNLSHLDHQTAWEGLQQFIKITEIN